MEKERKNTDMIPLEKDKYNSEELLQQAKKYASEQNYFYAERYYLRALKTGTGEDLTIPCECFKGLFEIHVHKKCYRSASKYLEDYIKCLNILNKPNDPSILLSVFNKVCIGEPIKIDRVEYYMDYKIQDKELKDFFLILMRWTNKDNYSKAISLIDERMGEYSKKYPEIDLNILRNLFSELNDIKNVKLKSLSNYYLEALKEKISNHDVKSIENIVELIVKNPYIDESILYNVFYTLIKNNYFNLVASMLNSLEITEKNRDVIAALKNAVANQRYYLNLPEEMKHSYTETIALGKQYFADGEYDKSLESYTNGRKITKGSIFDYYLGKLMFHTGHYDEAEHYFHNYIKQGSDKLSKTYQYLAMIAEKKNDSELSQKYLSKSKNYIILYDQYKCLDKMSEEETSLSKNKKDIS